MKPSNCFEGDGRVCSNGIDSCARLGTYPPVTIACPLGFEVWGMGWPPNRDGDVWLGTLRALRTLVGFHLTRIGFAS